MQKEKLDEKKGCTWEFGSFKEPFICYKGLFLQTGEKNVSKRLNEFSQQHIYFIYLFIFEKEGEMSIMQKEDILKNLITPMM